MPGAGSTINEGFETVSGPLGDATGYGGTCVAMLAAAAINIGDAVYQSAANHVTKGATANNALAVGVVVGGRATKGRCYPEVKMGTAAALAAEDWVLVCFTGKVRCVADGTIAAGDKLGFGATAGRVLTVVAAATDIIGTLLGRALGAATVGNEVDVLVSLI